MPRRWRDALIKEYGPICWLCGQDIDLTLPDKHPMAFSVDHVRPRHVGGRRTMDNLWPAHQRCNTRRATRKAEDFCNAEEVYDYIYTDHNDLENEE